VLEVYRISACTPLAFGVVTRLWRMAGESSDGMTNRFVRNPSRGEKLLNSSVDAQNSWTSILKEKEGKGKS